MATSGLPRDASAYHDGDARVVTSTAHTLRDGELRVGIWRLDYGLLSWLDIGTYNAPWLLLAPNFQLKFQLWRNERWAFSLRAGLLYANVGPFLDDSDAQALMLPLELAGSYDVTDRISLTLAGTFTAIWGKGGYDSDQLQGAAAVSNAQIAANVQWRINRIWALAFDGRYVAHQGGKAAGTSYDQIDPATTVEIAGEIDSNSTDIRHAFSLAVGAIASWESFNLRFGAGYGNYNVPGLNVVLSKKLPFPQLDLFWRF